MSRFGASTPRRLWLIGRLQAVLSLAASTGKVRRIFVWGSFVTAKGSPKDVDILLIMDEDFETQNVPSAAQEVFDSVRARLLYESDVFWARASSGNDTLNLWLDTYQISKKLPETRYRGVGAAVIQTDDQMLLAQQCVANLRAILYQPRPSLRGFHRHEQSAKPKPLHLCPK